MYWGGGQVTTLFLRPLKGSHRAPVAINVIMAKRVGSCMLGSLQRAIQKFLEGVLFDDEGTCGFAS